MFHLINYVHCRKSKNRERKVMYKNEISLNDNLFCCNVQSVVKQSEPLFTRRF